MAGNADNQINEQNSSASANYGITAVQGREIFSMAEGVDNQNIVQVSSIALNIDIVAHRADKIASSDEDCSMPVGYRFVPTDAELIESYLMKKVNNKPLPPNDNIQEADFYGSDPSQLIQQFKQSDGGNEWYFLTSRNRKYPKGGRPNRATKNGVGYWKPTGEEKPVVRNGDAEIIGYRRNLDFHEGRYPDGKRTKWKMHEYKVRNSYIESGLTPRDHKKLENWVLCKIYVTRNKDGTNNVLEDEDHNSDVSHSRQSVNGASSNVGPSPRDVDEPPPMTGNNNAVDATRLAVPSSLQNPTMLRRRNKMHAPPNLLMDGVPSCRFRTASFRQNVNGASTMTGSYWQDIDGAPSPSMAGNNSPMHLSVPARPISNTSQQVVNGASSMAAGFDQENINGAPFETIELNYVCNSMQRPHRAEISSPQSYQNPYSNALPFQQDFNGVSAKGDLLQNSRQAVLNYVCNAMQRRHRAEISSPQSYQNQYSNALPFQQDFNGASAKGDLLQNSRQAISQNIVLNYVCNSIQRPHRAEISSPQSYQNPYSNASPFQQDFNGVSALGDSLQNPRQAVNGGVPFMAGNNQFSNAYPSYPPQHQIQHPNATSFEPTVYNGAMNNGGSLMAAGNNRNVFENRRSVAAQPHSNVQQPNATSSLATVSGRTLNNEGDNKEKDKKTPSATQPEDDENTLPTVGLKFEDLECYMDPSFFD